MLLLWIISLSYTTLMLYLHHDNYSWHSCVAWIHFLPHRGFFPQATLILHSWGWVTHAKNLFTLVSYRSFQLEPPKGLLHFAQAKEVHKSQEMCFWETISKRGFLLRKLLRNIPYLSALVSQQGIPNWWFHLRNFLEEDILLAVTERAVMEVLSNYHQSPQRLQGVPHQLFC